MKSYLLHASQWYAKLKLAIIQGAKHHNVFLFNIQIKLRGTQTFHSFVFILPYTKQIDNLIFD